MSALVALVAVVACGAPASPVPPSVPPAPSPPAPAVDASAPPGAPDGSPSADASANARVEPTKIEVSSVGAEPRRIFGHRYTAGSEERYRVRSRTELTPRGGEKKTIGFEGPLVLKVTSVESEGIDVGNALVDFRAGPYRKATGGESKPAEPPAAATGKGTARATVSGSVRVTALSGGDPDAEFESPLIAGSLLELGDPFPSEAVGVGAKWITTRILDGGRVLRATAYELVFASKDGVRVKVVRSEGSAVGGGRTGSEGELTYRFDAVLPTGQLTTVDEMLVPVAAKIESVISIEPL